jgi:hypothetical protein
MRVVPLLRDPPARSLRSHASTLALASAIALLAAILLAGPAQADVGEKIIDRCTHGESISGFSQQAYGKALKDISAGTEEYSNCAALIREAQLAAASGKGGPGTGAGGGPAVRLQPTPVEQTAIARAPHVGSAPLRVGNQTIRPGVVHANIASAFSTLPTPLIAMLAFLLVCLALAVGAAIRDRIRERRRA